MASLTSQLTALGAVFSSDLKSVSLQTEGEKWEQVAGQFMLRACPPGHQLINTADGKFSVNAQRCQVCVSDTYNTNPNNSAYTCLECPVHARCEDGIFLGGAPEATWEVDSTGNFKLMRCIVGYSFSNVTVAEQKCEFCEAGSYCSAGMQQRAKLCPSAMHSDPGAGSSLDCYARIDVVFSVLLAMQTSEFNQVSQDLFRTAVAASVGTYKHRVEITGVIQSGRRQNKFEVQTSIVTKSGKEADEIIAQHSEKSLKNALRNVGLPEGRFQLQPRLASQSFPTATVWTPVIVSLVVGFLIAFIAYMRYRSSMTIVSREEQLLRDMLVKVRGQLNLTRAHGYILTTERQTLWQRVCWARPQVIEWKSLDALAKM